MEYRWKIINYLSSLTARIACRESSPALTLIVKPIQYVDPHELPIAANEYVCHQLIKLLQSKGIITNTPEVNLVPAERKIHETSISIYHGICAIDDLGEHSRITTKTNLESLNDKEWPTWLYWFDRWIGRLDSAGDTNLLLVGDKIIPVDFAMSFHWACGARQRIHRVDFMDVTAHPRIRKCKSEESRLIIKSLTDDEIWDAVVTDIPREFISSAALVAYWSGLCFRRDIM